MNNPHHHIDNLSAERRTLLTIKRLQLELETLKQEKTEPIAIIGMSCRFPGGADSPEAFWQLLAEGRDAITEIPRERYDIDAFYDPDINAAGKTVSRWGGFLAAIDRFDPMFFGISPREAIDLDPQQRLLLEVSWEAMERAGLLPEKLFGSQTGVFTGLFNRDYIDTLYERMIIEKAINVTSYTGTGNGLSFGAGRLSYFLGLQGPSMTIDTVCSSSLVAVHLACQSIRNNECTMAFAGAANLIFHPLSGIITSKMRALSPEGHSKTFDASADGFVRGEGCGVVILKKLSQARADGDPILALIRGSAVNHDGRSNGLTAPNGLAQQAVIQQALQNAGVTPAQISYVETHGTGTALGDPIEVDALKAVLGQPRSNGAECVLGSVKTNIGHLEACAGMAGLIKTVLCMQHGQLPPILHLKKLNPHISFENTPFVLPMSLRAWPTGIERKYAGVSGAGLSGTNAHVVLEEPRTPDKTLRKDLYRDEIAYLLPLSARDPEALRQLALRYQSELAMPESILSTASLRDICSTASMRRTHYPYRIALAGQSHKELAARLDAFIAEKQIPAASSNPLPGIVFMFSGQGTQWIGMGQHLYACEPAFKATIDTCDSLLKEYASWSLIEELHADEQHSRLNETEIAQVALFAIQIALAALWRTWGILPQAVVGHSVGEIAAAHVAGVLSLDDAMRIVVCRGRLMQHAHGLGKMASVEISESRARSIQAKYAERLSLAAINSPTSVVFSGEAEALEEVLHLVESEGIFFRRLQVDYAFHSIQVEKFRDSLVQELQGLRPNRATIALISTVTGLPASGEEHDAAYWGRNMCQEVRFGPAIEALITLGYQTFLEISPRPALLQATRACLEQHAKPGLVLPNFKRGEDERSLMLASLGALYTQGYPIDWEQLYVTAEEPYTVVTLPTYQWQRKRYWSTEKETIFRSARSSPHKPLQHPLLGQRLRSALKEIVFESIIDANELAWLNDHRVYGAVIFPASAYVEMIMAAAKEALSTKSVQLSNLVIHRALLLPPESSSLVQMILHRAPDKTHATVQIFSCPEKEDANDQWQLYASGDVSVEHDSDLSAGDLSVLAEIQARCLDRIEHQQHYQSMQSMGMQYGQSFQGVRQLWRCDGEALASIVLPQQLENESAKYALHPALLDACLQAVTASMTKEHGEDDTSIYLPFSIDQVQLYARPQTNIWCHVRMRPQGVTTKTMLTADIQLLDQHGQSIARVSGLHLRRASPKALRLSEQPQTQDWLYELNWEQQARALPSESFSASAPKQDGAWLIFCDRSGTGIKLARRLQSQGEPCMLVFAERESESPEYTSIDPSNAFQFQQLVQEHFSSERTCRGIIHLWALDGVETKQAKAIDLEANQSLICGSVLHIVQAVAQKTWSNVPRLWIITRGSQAVNAEEKDLAIEQAPVWGLGRVLAIEQPNFHCKQIDLDHTHDDPEEIDKLTQELQFSGNENQVAFRAHKRYVARLVQSTLATNQHQSESASHFRSDSTYLITGGCGSLGLVIARWMVEQRGVKHLVLVSRRSITAETRAIIYELEQTEAQIVVISADVSQENQVARMLKTMQQTLPPLRGIIHAAGIIDDGILLHQNWTRFAQVMAPKIQGSWNLHTLTQALQLDFFILFSSGASLLGSAGQGNYAAANAFMDTLAHYRRSQGLPATSINWGAWADIGMATSSATVERRLLKDGMQSIEPTQGIELLEQLLDQSPAQIGVLPIDWKKFAKHFASTERSSFIIKLVDEIPAQAQDANDFLEEKQGSLLQKLKAAPASEQPIILQTYVAQAIRQVLGLEIDFNLEVGQDLFELGADSLTALELQNYFHSMLDNPIPASLIFEHPNVEELTTYLLAIALNPDTAVERN